MKKQLGLYVNGENKGAGFYEVAGDGRIYTPQGMPIVNSAATARHGLSRETVAAALANGTWKTVLPADCICHMGINDHIEFVTREEWVARDKAQWEARIHAGKPANAIAAYKKYRGCAERAWEAEDEVASMLIKQHYDAPCEKRTDPVTKEDY